MPLYEYQCRSCGVRSEVLQRMSDDPLTECDQCGGQVQRLVSAPAVQFKGSGWYVTDYAGKKGGGKESASGSSGGDSASSGSDGGSSSSGSSDKKSA